MREGQGSRGERGIGIKVGCCEVFGQRPEPVIFQAADVELPACLGVLHEAQERVGRRLHQTLSVHHPLAGGSGCARGPAAEGLENGAAGFLDLQEQRRTLFRHQQGHGAEGADAAHADDLEGHVRRFVARQHVGNFRPGPGKALANQRQQVRLPDREAVGLEMKQRGRLLAQSEPAAALLCHP